MHGLMRSTTNNTTPNTISLRGAPVPVIVGGFNQVRSAVPGSSGTVHRNAIRRYRDTPIIVARGGNQIWAEGHEAKPEGYDVKVIVDAEGGIHLELPPDFEPPEGERISFDKVATTCTPMHEPVAQAQSSTRTREVELAV